jgi:hypothetical protein
VSLGVSESQHSGRGAVATQAVEWLQDREMVHSSAFIASFVLAAALVSLEQVGPRTLERSVEAAQNRIATLDKGFQEAVDHAQAQDEAANCRVDCPTEVSQRITKEMQAAMSAIVAKIHGEVDSFIGSIARSPTTRRLDPEVVANSLSRILPSAHDARQAFAGGAPENRYLIVAYCLHKGAQMGLGATSVTVRAYNATADGVLLTDVTGNDMDGFDELVVKQVRPLVFPPATPPIQTTYVLLSGYLTGANGPRNRMRLYAYDGKNFRPVWMPADIWGRFDVRVTPGGFTVEGEDYRPSRKRRDDYVLSDGVVTLSRPR